MGLTGGLGFLGAGLPGLYGQQNALQQLQMQQQAWASMGLSNVALGSRPKRCTYCGNQSKVDHEHGCSGCGARSWA